MQMPDFMAIFDALPPFVRLLMVVNLASMIYVIVDVLARSGTAYHKLLWSILAVMLQLVALILYLCLRKETVKLGEKW